MNTDSKGDRENRKSEMGRGPWVTDDCNSWSEFQLNFEAIQTDMAVNVMQCPVSLSFQWHVCCILDKTKDFPNLNISS